MKSCAPAVTGLLEDDIIVIPDGGYVRVVAPFMDSVAAKYGIEDEERLG